MTPIHCEEYTAFSSLSFHWKTNDAMSSPCDINVSDYSQDKFNAWLCCATLCPHLRDKGEVGNYGNVSN